MVVGRGEGGVGPIVADGRSAIFSDLSRAHRGNGYCRWGLRDLGYRVENVQGVVVRMEMWGKRDDGSSRSSALGL